MFMSMTLFKMLTRPNKMHSSKDRPLLWIHRLHWLMMTFMNSHLTLTCPIGNAKEKWYVSQILPYNNEAKGLVGLMVTKSTCTLLGWWVW